ncbi:MAG: hypothetical protein AAF846_27445 [Chloroflexota bacterium]
MLKQEVKGYSRNVPSVQYICACPNCPHCQNQPLTGHVNRKYCSHEAMLEARRQKRREQALLAGRTPGKVGRPKKQTRAVLLYVLHLQASDLYLLGCSDDLEAYQQTLARYQDSNPNIQELWIFEQGLSQADMPILHQQFATQFEGQWLRFESTSIQHLKIAIEARITNA